jgi:hypothetical protein
MHYWSLRKAGSIINFPVRVTAPTRCPLILRYSGFWLNKLLQIKAIEDLYAQVGKVPSGKGDSPTAKAHPFSY